MTEPTTVQQVLDELVEDPTGRPQMCSAEEFPGFLESWVADCAPRVFAVVQEYGGRVDARIAGWGMDFDDEVDVLSVDGGIYKGLSKAEDVLPYFGFGPHISARIVPVNPDATTPE